MTENKSQIDLQVGSLVIPKGIHSNTKKFLVQCDEYVRHIKDLPDSPWVNKCITEWAISDRKIRLGAIQKKLLLFLQDNYFRKGMPCFASQAYIARRLEINRSQLCQVIKSLVDKKLIVRIQWVYKTRRINTMILPLVPEIADHFDEDQVSKMKLTVSYNILFPKFSKSQGNKNALLYITIIYINTLFNSNTNINITNVSNRFIKPKGTLTKEREGEASICTSPRLVDVERALTRSTLVGTTPAVKSNLALRSTLVGTTPAVKSNLALQSAPTLSNSAQPLSIALDNKVHQLHNPVRDLKKEKSMALERFMLKREQHRDDQPCQHIIDDLKLKHDYEFDELKIEEQTAFNSFISFHYGIDIQTYFKVNRNPRGKTRFYHNNARALRKQFVKLMCNGHALNYVCAEHIINYWNQTVDRLKANNWTTLTDIDARWIRKVNLNRKDTKAYLNAVIAINYCLIYRCGRDVNRLIEAFDRMERIQQRNDCGKKAPFYWQTCTIDKFLMNAEENQYLEAYLAPIEEFDRWLYYRPFNKISKDRLDAGYKQFTKLYCDQFYFKDKDKGKKICYRFEYLIKTWLSRKIDETVHIKKYGKQRKMYGYKLITEGWDGVEQLPPLIQRFLFYLNRVHRIERLKFIDMFTKETWKQFLDDEMRTSVGLDDFYKIEWIK